MAVPDRSPRLSEGPPPFYRLAGHNIIARINDVRLRLQETIRGNQEFLDAVRRRREDVTSGRTIGSEVVLAMSDDDDWDQQMAELDERTAKRRAKTNEQDEEMQQAIREAEERRDRDKPKE